MSAPLMMNVGVVSTGRSTPSSISDRTSQLLNGHRARRGARLRHLYRLIGLEDRSALVRTKVTISAT